MNILVIGSKGFIGSHTLEYLSHKAECQCWGCDVVVDYIDQRYFLVDMANSDYHEIFNSVPFDYCINCSGAASVQGSITHPHRDFILNTANVFKILEAIRRDNPSCRFLNISSAAVYGNPPKLPVPESQPPSPLSPYGLHKHQAEEICREFNEHFGLGTCSARIFSAYGPGLKKQVFWDVYHKSKNNHSISLAGTGNETRDYIFIHDLVQAIYCIIEHAAFKGEQINVANGIGTTTREAVSTLLKIISWNGELIFDGQQRMGDPLYWKADISTLLSFGYRSQYTLEEGLTQYVEWLEGWEKQV